MGLPHPSVNKGWDRQLERLVERVLGLTQESVNLPTRACVGPRPIMTGCSQFVCFIKHVVKSIRDYSFAVEVYFKHSPRAL